MEENNNMVELAVEITTAWLQNPNTRCQPEEVHSFLKGSYATLIGLSQPDETGQDEAAAPAEEFKPAVTLRKSVANPDYIYSMIDGKPYRTLRRHLSTHGLTPETYRERYGLKADYPMVAPNYAAQRSKLAKDLGLGRKGAAAREAAAATRAEPEKAAATPAKRGRPPRKNAKAQAESAEG